jgi:hypothetical protein
MVNKMEKSHTTDCDCDKPEIHESFKGGICSKEQILECHGNEYFEKLEKKEK